METNREAVTKDCTCPVWRENIDRINNLIVLAWVHGSRYEGAKFEFCPWCGRALIVNEEVIEVIDKRLCNNCGETWDDDGNPTCPNCGSDDTELVEEEEDDDDEDELVPA